MTSIRNAGPQRASRVGSPRGAWKPMRAVLLLALLACACERPGSTPRYEIIGGRLAEMDPRTGELTLEMSAADESAGTLHCTVTADTEITVNDLATPVGGLRAGDVLEVIGYRQRAGGLDGFVATSIFVEREAEMPRSPEPLDPMRRSHP